VLAVLYGSESTAWTAVLAGLIPILGIGAAGYLLYYVVRKGESTDDEDDEDD
jgi:hypothetical protein